MPSFFSGSISQQYISTRKRSLCYKKIKVSSYTYIKSCNAVRSVFGPNILRYILRFVDLFIFNSCHQWFRCCHGQDKANSPFWIWILGFVAEPTRSQLPPYLATSRSCIYAHWVPTSRQGGPGSCCATARSFPSQASLAKILRHPPAFVTTHVSHLHDLSSNHTLLTSFQAPVFPKLLFRNLSFRHTFWHPNPYLS